MGLMTDQETAAGLFDELQRQRAENSRLQQELTDERNHVGKLQCRLAEATANAPALAQPVAEWRTVQQHMLVIAGRVAEGKHDSSKAFLRAITRALACDKALMRKIVATRTPAALESANEMRLALVGQVHELCAQVERTLYAFGADDEARAQAQGAIDHARKVAQPYNYNGPLRSDIAAPASGARQ